MHQSPSDLFTFSSLCQLHPETAIPVVFKQYLTEINHKHGTDLDPQTNQYHITVKIARATHDHYWRLKEENLLTLLKPLLRRLTATCLPAKDFRLTHHYLPYNIKIIMTVSVYIKNCCINIFAVNILLNTGISGEVNFHRPVE